MTKPPVLPKEVVDAIEGYARRLQFMGADPRAVPERGALESAIVSALDAVREGALREVREYLVEERARHTSGGMTTGESRRMPPSTLRELERLAVVPGECPCGCGSTTWHAPTLRKRINVRRVGFHYPVPRCPQPALHKDGPIPCHCVCETCQPKEDKPC